MIQGSEVPPVGSSIASRRRHRSAHRRGRLGLDNASQRRAGANRAGHARRRRLELRKSVGMGQRMSANQNRRPPRSLLRISLRALLVLVLLTGGWMGWLVQSARTQRAAVAAIQRSDGYVEYEWDITNPARKPGGGPPWPKWLVDRLGVDYFYNVVAVDLDDRATDLDLVRVGNLTRLRSLQLSRSQVTDAGLEYLQGLTSLKSPDPSSHRRDGRRLGAPARPNRPRRASPRLNRLQRRRLSTSQRAATPQDSRPGEHPGDYCWARSLESVEPSRRAGPRRHPRHR